MNKEVSFVDKIFNARMIIILMSSQEEKVNAAFMNQEKIYNRTE